MYETVGSPSNSDSARQASSRSYLSLPQWYRKDVIFAVAPVSSSEQLDRTSASRRRSEHTLSRTCRRSTQHKASHVKSRNLFDVPAHEPLLRRCPCPMLQSVR